MKLISLTICRNSDWTIRPVIEHALHYCDMAVAMCHKCNDRTVEILRSFGDDKVSVISTDDADWNEMDHRQQALERGRALGGTHFVILDDDEMLTDNLVPAIRPMIEDLAPGEVLQQPLRNCWRGLDWYRTDRGSPFSRTWKSVAFHDHPDLLWSSEGGYQHHHTHPRNSKPRRVDHPLGGGWLHFQHANWDRLVTKQTWYMCMELCRYGEIRANYRGTMDETGLEVSPVPSEWWSPLRDRILLTKPPWQARDIRRMVKEKGEDFFTSHNIDTRAATDPWNMYSQNDEEYHILKYFDGSPPGRLYDIGAWDGKTFSNSLALIERGWKGVLVEPDPPSFMSLMDTLAPHKQNVKLVNAAIDLGGGLAPFWSSGGDAVSTLDPRHRDKWQGAVGEMRELYLKRLAPQELFGNFGAAEFINLDVEGVNMELFKELPFQWTDLKMICVEHDRRDKEMEEIASKHGFRKLHLTAENLLLVR